MKWEYAPLSKASFDQLIVDGTLMVSAHQSDFTVVKVDDIARMLNQGRSVGCDVHLMIANPQHHRTAATGDDDRLRARRVEHGDPVSPSDEPQRRPHRL